MINFKNTPIIQEGSNYIYTRNIERELGKTKQLLRKMLAGSAVVSAVRNAQNQHEITIGAYKKITQSSGGFSPMGGFGSAMGGGVMIYRPMISSSWSRITRFKMLVDPTTLKHINGEMQPSISEQIQSYSEAVKIPEDGSAIFVANKFHQFAYYDKGERKLVITKF